MNLNALHSRTFLCLCTSETKLEVFDYIVDSLHFNYAPMHTHTASQSNPIQLVSTNYYNLVIASIIFFITLVLSEAYRFRTQQPTSVGSAIFYLFLYATQWAIFYLFWCAFFFIADRLHNWQTQWMSVCTYVCWSLSLCGFCIEQQQQQEKI